LFHCHAKTASVAKRPSDRSHGQEQLLRRQADTDQDRDAVYSENFTRRLAAISSSCRAISASEATMRCIRWVSLVILLMPSAHAALPGDSADGKRLHDANCMGCHDGGIYTRKDRVVRSLDALRQQLEGCTHMAKKEFSPTETRNIIKYLNDQFYQFR
jgi:hypothetical protein